jgi:hypothetical protein
MRLQSDFVSSWRPKKSTAEQMIVGNNMKTNFLDHQDKLHLPSRRGFLSIIGIAPFFTACDTYTSDSGYTYVTFFHEKPALVESKGIMMSTGRISRLRQQSGLRRIELRDIGAIVGKLTQTPVTSGRLSAPLPIGYNNLSTHIDKRFFLASIKPDILFVVPHAYKKLVSDDLKKESWDDGSISIEFSNLLEQLRQKHSVRYPSAHLASVGWTNYVELSTIFPVAQGIQVLSDQWYGMKTLEQFEAEGSDIFKIVPAQLVPGHLRLVLKK